MMPDSVIGWPDLVETVVGNPPASVANGTSFAMSDTVANQGNVPAGTSYTAAYLSLDAVKDAGDRALTGTRSAPALTAGATSAGSRSFTVPLGTTPGTYYVFVCADATNRVSELMETNNCKGAATQVIVY